MLSTLLATAAIIVQAGSGAPAIPPGDIPSPPPVVREVADGAVGSISPTVDRVVDQAPAVPTVREIIDTVPPVSGVPVFPSVPTVPGVSSVPGVPDVPVVPTAPSVPGLPPVLQPITPLPNPGVDALPPVPGPTATSSPGLPTVDTTAPLPADGSTSRPSVAAFGAIDAGSSIEPTALAYTPAGPISTPARQAPLTAASTASSSAPVSPSMPALALAAGALLLAAVFALWRHIIPTLPSSPQPAFSLLKPPD